MRRDEFAQPGRVWRVRVQLADHPGQLAALSARLAEQGCNLLGMSVLPVATSEDTSSGVIDELVLRAPESLGNEALRSLVEATGASCIGIIDASVKDLVDLPTALLRTVGGTLAGEGSLDEAIRLVLAADSTSRSKGRGTDAIVLQDNGHEAVIPVGGGDQVTATRAWTPFTDVELARVPALLAALTPHTPDPDPRPMPSLRQLSALDVQFLNAETARTPTHVGILTVLDPATAAGGQVSLAALRALLAERLHLVPALRWRLHTTPLGMDLPYWLDAGQPDLTRHVRELHLPSPGTDAQLGEAVAALAETALRRDAPLWEAHLVHGLSGGRQALYTKVHHAVIDGVSGAEVLAIMYDLRPEPARVPRPSRPLATDPAPSTTEMLRRGARRASGAPWQLARTLPKLPLQLGRLPALARIRPAPPTPFNQELTARRAFAFASLPLEQVRQVKDSLGFTVNDVVMAVCTSALRRWLLERDALPASPVVAAIPVSIRTPEQVGTAGNQITFMLAGLPTDVADPAQRLAVLHDSLLAAKAGLKMQPMRLLERAGAVIPQAFHGAATRALIRLSRLGPPPFNLFVSNVPGPQVPLYAVGARVVANYPVSVVSDIGGGINITAMSYDGRLDFGVITCPDVFPDGWDLAEHLGDALTDLLEVSSQERTRRAIASDASLTFSCA